MSRFRIHSIFALALASPTLACGDDSDADDEATSGDSGVAEESTTDAGTRDPAQLAMCPEDDLQVVAFAGPAFDPQTGALVEPLPVPHVVATTVGWTEGPPSDVFQTQTNLVIGDLFQREGLLGASFGMSSACGSARTITLWRDEAAMMQFVLGETHMTAIQVALPHAAAWETTHWTESTSTQAPTWDRVRAQLDDVRPQ